MSKLLYHASLKSNDISILNEGILASIDGCVYCCEKPEDCLKFILIRQCGSTPEPITIFAINAPDELVEETFDHSYNFFKCRCFGIYSDVPVEWIDLNKCLEYNPAL